MSLDTEQISALDMSPDNNDFDDNISVKELEPKDQLLISVECDDNIEECCEAMLAAMDVQSLHQQRPAHAMSVEACLARFTDKETLSGANMITCETCSRVAAEAAGCYGNDDNNNATANSGDHTSSSSKTSGTGRFVFVASVTRDI